MLRLFSGLEIPAEVTAALTLRRGGLPGARWVEPENYHVTLRFFGDVDHAAARDIAAGLDEIERMQLRLELDGLSAFGGGRPRALIATLALTPDLAELQAEHERVARRAGLAPETRKFTPHVTLARLSNVSSRAVADWLAMQGQFPRLGFEVGRFVLFSSRASTGGGPYLIEAAYPLEERY